MVAAEQYKTFPPKWKNLRLPLSSRGDAASTLAMWSPCRPSALLMQRIGWVAVHVMGARVLPGAVNSWEPPWDCDTGEQLGLEWQAAVGDFDTMGIYEQPQRHRHGLVVLLFSSGRPVAFLKLRRSSTDAVHPVLAGEHRALQLIDDAGITAFSHPRALGLGVVQRWTYLITSAIAGGLDRPSTAGHVDAVLSDIQLGLRQLPGSDEAPDDWEPMHGDLTPWNLRVSGNGVLTLVDWEAAAWGPPGADAVLLYASRRALFGTPPPSLPAEATDYWLDRVTGQKVDSLDRRLQRDLTVALREIASRTT